MRIPSALTKPIITERGMNRMILASPSTPNRIWMMPARITVGSRYSTPWVCTSGATTSATAPAAAVIIAGRPPRIDIEIASTTEAMRLTFGSTPAITEKEMTSGIRASVVTAPASASVVRSRGFRRACRVVGLEVDVEVGVAVTLAMLSAEHCRRGWGPTPGTQGHSGTGVRGHSGRDYPGASLPVGPAGGA